MRLFSDRAGAVAVITALVAVPIIGMAAFATDSLLLQARHQRMQAVADLAAFSAGIEYASNGVAANAQTQAIAVAANLGYTSSQVTVNIPPQTGPHAGVANAIEVIVTAPATQYLSKVLTNASGQSIHSRAVALATSTCHSDAGGNDTGGSSGTNYVLSNNETVTLPDMNGDTIYVSGWGTVDFSHDANGATLIVDSSCISANTVGHDFNGSTFIDNYVPTGMNYVSVAQSCNGCTFTGGSLGSGGVFTIGHDANGSSFTFVMCPNCSASGGGTFGLAE